MLGYVTIEKSELKMREFDVYSGYYCGICKSIGKRYGQIPRLTLSYDAAFLALLLSSTCMDKDQIYSETCIAHPIKKRPITKDNQWVDYAADVMLILAYHKFWDDWNDEKKITGIFGIMVFKQYYKKLYKKYNALCTVVENNLKELAALEAGKCKNLDMISDKFAEVMEKIFVSGPGSDRNHKILGSIGKHLGKWIYMIDALDDIEKDIKENSYNPLVYRFDFNEENETVLKFKERIREQVEFNLFQYLAQLSAACDLLEFKKNKEIIENVVFMGLRRKTEAILEKGINEE